MEEACGVFAAYCFDATPAFPYVYWGLRALNHRGHQSHGILTYNGKFNVYRALDLVPKIKKEDAKKWEGRLPGNIGIGNVRYATSGKSDEKSLIKGAQPIVVNGKKLRLATVFNGNVVNTKEIKNEIGKNFSYECDLELLTRKLYLEFKEEKDIFSAVESCMKEVEGAFSVVGLNNKGEMFGFKDPHGIKPLCFGKAENLYAFSSESVGLDINGIDFMFEVKPGEIITFDRKDFHRCQLVNPDRKAFCSFEFAYFSRPDTRYGNKYVYEIREEFGRNLAREYSDLLKDVDIIISMPETADDAAYGLHEESGIRWERATRRHRYVTERAFILLPNQRQRTISRKINILEQKVFGKNVVVTDDSIVRGDTTKVTVKKLRDMGAKKVYIFVTFPRITSPCFYGIDMANYEELIGSRYEPEEIAKIVGADGVYYQSLKDYVKATGFREEELCLGCITGKYPTRKAQEIADLARKDFEMGIERRKRIYEDF
ncbi:MAG: amidophosphoribosyltransferase [Candidatus Aenigmatarchaeota archaeon]